MLLPGRAFLKLKTCVDDFMKVHEFSVLDAECDSDPRSLAPPRSPAPQAAFSVDECCDPFFDPEDDHRRSPEVLIQDRVGTVLL